MTTPSKTKRKPPDIPDYSWENPESYIYQVLFSLVIISIIILNITVIILYSRMTQLLRRKIPNLLLLNQALVDLLIGLSAILRVVCSSHTCPDEVNNMKFFFLEYTAFLAVGVLLVGTLERFVSVKAPFQHRAHVTRGRVIMMIVCTWSITMLPALVYSSYVFDTHKDKEDNAVQHYYIGHYALLLLAMLVVFIILGLTYWEIRVSISRRHNPGINSISSPAVVTDLSSQINREVESQRKLTRIFSLMSIVYLVTVAPPNNWINCFGSCLAQK